MILLLAGCGSERQPIYRTVEESDSLQPDSSTETGPSDSNSSTQPEERAETPPQPESVPSSEMAEQTPSAAPMTQLAPNTVPDPSVAESTAAKPQREPTTPAETPAAGDSVDAKAMTTEPDGDVSPNAPKNAATAVAASKKSQPMLPGDVILEPRTPKLLIAEKNFREEGPGQALRVSFDDIDLLKVLNMEPVPENAIEMFPDWLSQLDGKRVRIRGFMFPTLTQTGITYFQHVRDNEICCFGRTPKVYDRISTILASGKSTNYIQGRPFDVVGILRFDPVYEDGEWLQLYVLEEAIVIP